MKRNKLKRKPNAKHHTITHDQPEPATGHYGRSIMSTVSEGAREASTLHTSPHNDQWRRPNAVQKPSANKRIPRTQQRKK